MKTQRNDALFVRNERLGLFANLGGMALLVAAVFVLFNAPGGLGLYFVFLVAGMLLVQAGLTFGRLGRRTDLALDKALKSLDDSYQLFHHTGPVQHLLTGPSGVWILIPRHTKGEVHFDKARQKWENRGGNILMRLWRWLTDERLGRPHYEAMIEAGRLDQFLRDKWTSKEDVPVNAVAVFLNNETLVQAGTAPFPAVNLKRLSKTVSRNKPDQSFSKASLNRLNKILSE
jgi:hypothetical protein